MAIFRWFCLVLPAYLLALTKAQETSCSAFDQERDPALKEMTYDVGDGKQTTWVYVEPGIADFYEADPPAKTKVTPKFNGFAGKFINMSNQKATLYWEDKSGNIHPMRTHEPFSASGTATFPGHQFLFTKDQDSSVVLKRFLVGHYPENLYVFDPYTVQGDPVQTEANLAQLTPDERAQFEAWRKTLSFNEQYKAFTGRSYLANYLRKPTKYFMWRADYFNQEHWVTTKETHFVELPPDHALEPVLASGDSRVHEEASLKEYRQPDHESLNMTLKVLSVAPRVFEIQNFLSHVEINHILKLATGIELKMSTTGDIAQGEESASDTRRTRTSLNSWVPRENSPIIDSIYRRAADLLRMDETLMRYRSHGEYPELGTKHSIAENLQLVHYAHTQEYTAHHDFGFSRIGDEKQGARFATVLFYLNGGMKGGET